MKKYGILIMSLCILTIVTAFVSSANAATLYKFTDNHAAGSWTGTDAEAVHGGLGGELRDVKSNFNDLTDESKTNGTITSKYKPINTFASCTISSISFKIVSGPSGSEVNVYVFAVSSGDTVIVTGGSIYGLFATEPVKNSTVTVDGTRHIGTFSNTEITMPKDAEFLAIASTSEPAVTEPGATMPSGASYLAVTNTAESTIEIDSHTVSEKVQVLENEMSEVLPVIETPQLFTETGYINTSGTLSVNAAYKATDYVSVTENGTYIPLKYKVYGNEKTCIAYFDGEKALLQITPIGETSALTEKTGTLEYISGAVYVRLCTYFGSGYTDSYAKYATIKNTMTGIIPYPTDYQGREICVFNKILCVGDSLTQGVFNFREDSSIAHYVTYADYSYPTYLKKITGCDVVNMGRSGATSLEWYEYYQNYDLSGYDCAIIQLGVNDASRYETWGQNSIDGFTGIINKLKNENKNIKIFVANMPRGRSYDTAKHNAMSAAISEFITELDDPQVILLDMHTYAHTVDSAAYNCGHFSALGYWRLAQDYVAYISYYIFMNKSDFKEVQFIGTDYFFDPIN